MTGQLIGTLILWLIVAVIVIAIIVYLVNWLYRRSSKEVSFVRTGLFGEKVVINGGAATVVCPDIITADATIHVIDHVLQPVDEMACPGGSSVPGSSTPSRTTR